MKTSTLLPFVLAAAVISAGCQTGGRHNTVPGNQIFVEQKTERGRVVQVRDVIIEGQPTGIAQSAAIAGAAASLALGSGTRSAIGGMGVGYLVGHVAGEAIEKHLRRTAAQEIQVKLESGALIVVTQPTSPPVAPGAEVIVARGDSGTRILNL